MGLPILEKSVNRGNIAYAAQNNQRDNISFSEAGMNEIESMVTAKSTEIDTVKGLDQGADDYITKPFGVMELISRVKALLRRSGNISKSEKLTLDKIEVYPDSRTCCVDGINIELTYKEYELLSLLLKNAGIVMKRDVLMERIWGIDFQGESRTLDMHIKTLRQKLGDAGQHINTVRNVGYMAK